MKPRFLAYLSFVLVSCGQAEDTLHKPLTNMGADTIIHPALYKKRSGSLPVFEKAHPNAKRVMNEGFYFALADEAAPFGNQEGADAYLDLTTWREAHKQNDLSEFLSTLINDMGYPKFDLLETNFEKLKPYLLERELGSRFMSGVDATIVAVAFGQLYLEGIVDGSIKETAKTAIQRQLNPELLAFWGDPGKTEREVKLKKMLTALNHIP